MWWTQGVCNMCTLSCKQLFRCFWPVEFCNTFLDFLNYFIDLNKIKKNFIHRCSCYNYSIIIWFFSICSKKEQNKRGGRTSDNSLLMLLWVFVVWYTARTIVWESSFFVVNLLIVVNCTNEILKGERKNRVFSN